MNSLSGESFRMLLGDHEIRIRELFLSFKYLIASGSDAAVWTLGLYSVADRLFGPLGKNSVLDFLSPNYHVCHCVLPEGIHFFCIFPEILCVYHSTYIYIKYIFRWNKYVYISSKWWLNTWLCNSLFSHLTIYIQDIFPISQVLTHYFFFFNSCKEFYRRVECHDLFNQTHIDRHWLS